RSANSRARLASGAVAPPRIKVGNARPGSGAPREPDTLLKVTDENCMIGAGAPLAEGDLDAREAPAPPFVLTEANLERWNACVRLSELWWMAHNPDQPPDG